MSAVKARVKEFGRNNSFKGKTVSEAYSYLDNLLLNGMPCDHVNQKIEEDENHIIWKQVVNIHAKYWEQIGGNALFYDQIRKDLIYGILEASGIEFHADNDIFTIISKE